jgi:diadenylate cyclase
MVDLFNDLIFMFQRLSWLSVIDIFIVTAIFFALMMVVKNTQAVSLMRGMVLVVILLSLMTSVVELPAFSWLVRATLPALMLSIPVIFAPELRRALERLGRAGGVPFARANTPSSQVMQATIRAVVAACGRLSQRQHGALIILQRGDTLEEYMKTGVRMDSTVTPEVLLQIFYPNTPLHDGAVIITQNRISSASSVMPLSASGILNRTPDRQMGLRHRAALGISEVSDAIAVVVSEETGSISVAHGGRMIRKLDGERLENILLAFYRSPGREKLIQSPFWERSRSFFSASNWKIDDLLQAPRQILKSLPSLLLALILAMAVWVAAVLQADPTDEKPYPNPVAIEIVGQDPGLIITNNIISQVNLTLSAPQSIWQKLIRDDGSVRAMIDLSGLSAGKYEVPVQVQIGIRPVKVISYTPQTITLALENIVTRNMTIHLVESGDVAVGFEAHNPSMNLSSVTITGPESSVKKVAEIRAGFNINGDNKPISQVINLQALDENEKAVDGITISPNNVTVNQEIVQKGGFRNVVVKVNLKGQVASGYRVANISVYPPIITVFSPDQQQVDNLPGYVETTEIVLTDSKDDMDERVGLNLPVGISVVGEQFVQVHVSVASIESSLTLSNMPVEVIGLPENYKASVSPAMVDVIVSGPIPILDRLTAQDVRVIVNMSGAAVGTEQIEPAVELKITDLKVQSILPGSVEITVMIKPAETPTVSGRLPVATSTPKPAK